MKEGHAKIILFIQFSPSVNTVITTMFGKELQPNMLTRQKPFRTVLLC